MYNLTLHIEYLLLRHDCVAVPGIGAFLNEYLPARFDESTGCWMPMSRAVRFNAALSHDDGLLANSFARRHKVSFEEGRGLLMDSVESLLKSLQSNCEVSLGNLGVLQFCEGKLVFTPGDSASKIQGRFPAPVAIPMQNKPETETELPDTSADAVRFDTRRNYYIPVNKMFARVAACLVCAIVAALTMIIPSTDRARIDKASVVPVEKIMEKDRISDKPVKNSVSKAIKSASPASATPASEASSVQNAAKIPATMRYHAIVATFNTKAEAQNYIESHNVAEFDMHIVAGRTKTRVSALSGDNRDSLAAAMRRPAFRSRFADAWIWTAE